MQLEKGVPNGRSSFWHGVRGQIPIAIGVVPFGLIFGVLGLAAGLTPWQTFAMSSIVFAGSAQFIGAQLFGVGTPTAVVWLTTFIVNVRHVLYSTTLGPQMQHLPRRWRWLLAYLLTDEAFATTAIHYADHRIPLTFKHYYFLGSGVTLWSVWQLSTAVGILLGAEIPASWSLDFTLALTFIGIVVPALTSRPQVATAVSAGIVALLTFSLPYRLGLMLAALVGIAVGYTLERLQKGQREKLSSDP